MNDPQLTHVDAARVEQFMSLYAAHQRRLYSYVTMLVPLSTDADDIFQEANVVLWRKFGEFHQEMSFFAWACGIVRYEVLKFREKHTRAAKLLDPAVLDHISDIAVDHIERLDDVHRQALSDCLERLSASDLQLMRRRYDDRTPVQAIALHMNRSPNAISKSLGRIRRLLFNCISSALGNSSPEGRMP